MESYKQMVVNWSIFTLSLQLIFCASVCSNLFANAELLCSEEPEKFVSDRGVQSSLLYDLHPGKTQTLCKRLFSAPDHHGFFVRLQRPDSTYGLNKKVHVTNKSIYGGSKRNSTSNTCPMQIYSSNDPAQPPWRVDPCQLEDNGMQEEPVRLLQGHLRVVWNHGGNMPSYKLLLTVLGKGEPCRDADKHPCLIFGEEKVFCISEDLLCDGVQNCPVGSEYNSDEDQDFCARRQLVSMQEPSRLNIWEHFSIGILRNIFRGDETTPHPEWQQHDRVLPDPDSDSEEDESEETDKTDQKGPPYNRGLSKYGPWGYLMLGMLICGGALLVCGLWECCCHSLKVNVDSGASNDPPTILIDSSGQTTIIDATMPPQYDDLDEPPSYSALFPIQKSSTEDLTRITLPQQIMPTAPLASVHQPSQSSSLSSTTSDVQNRNV